MTREEKTKLLKHLSFLEKKYLEFTSNQGDERNKASNGMSRKFKAQKDEIHALAESLQAEINEMALSRDRKEDEKWRSLTIDERFDILGSLYCLRGIYAERASELGEDCRAPVKNLSAFFEFQSAEIFALAESWKAELNRMKLSQPKQEE